MSNNQNELCKHCNNQTRSYGTKIRCANCKSRFHVRCCPISSEEFNHLSELGIGWFCNECNDDIFPFCSLSNDDIIDLFDVFRDQGKIPTKKTKCGCCTGKFKKNDPFALCTQCSSFFRLSCCKLTKNDFPLAKDWKCNKCIIQNLPFSSITNDDFILTSYGFDEASSEILKNVPSFSIKTLLDQFPGEKFAEDDFVSDSVGSKYYTPAEFLTEKFSKKSFSMIHLNIASLSRHIDELRSLLTLLGHPFNIIAITETRLHDSTPLVDVNIDGYDFHHKETPTQCGGAAIYIRSDHEYEILKQLTAAHNNISESVFLEIKNKNKNNLVIGCIYRHPRNTIEEFCSTFLDKALHNITKSKKKCILLGDFNIDLIKYETQSSVSVFYDQISAHGFRPLILQPSRISSNSATLIDNIFINDLACCSRGGNLTTSISDHFMQFSQIDLFENNEKHSKK